MSEELIAKLGDLMAQRLSVLQLARMVGHRDIRSLQTYYNETAESMARLLYASFSETLPSLSSTGRLNRPAEG